MDQEIKNTLGSIIEYIGADDHYKNNAQLITYLEWLVGKAKSQMCSGPCK